MRFMESHVMVASISFLLLFMAYQCARNDLGYMGAFRVSPPKDCVARCIPSKVSIGTFYYICCGEEIHFKQVCQQVCENKKTCCQYDKTCCKIQS
ncbi:hypothetical protein HanXRQr2_Chr08g0340911 [Helianthus annuus]|uniref:Uncharacterized protein n=1 Tax=Helianthus annuus TaxID=4232 RepID=A0A251U6E2_HELAN|nr:hypothetical protein HanXRQr2_Chr08g0340911 [Helianthus annuus]KAJ0547086.1 hypothetical protein HanIR_Chr08g0368161 [Helianthus annuus]KAJ0901787.1 hypothetical protein HanPSC8_Chr08g0329351 [Helianthus annuus]